MRLRITVLDADPGERVEVITVNGGAEQSVGTVNREDDSLDFTVQSPQAAVVREVMSVAEILPPVE